jgi:predicted phage-related endonuclease
MKEIRTIDRETWLLLRGLGGSEAASACGLSDNPSQLELWARKRGLVSAPDLSSVEFVRWGSIQEEAICRETVKRHADVYQLMQDEVEEIPEVEAFVENEFSFYRQPFMRSKVRDWQTVSTDFVIKKEGRIGFIEAKNRGFGKAGEWEEGELAAGVLCQVLHAFAVCPSFEFAIVGALLHGNCLKCVWIERKDCEKDIENLVTIETEFIRSVELGEAPPAGGSESSRKILLKIHPDDNGLSIGLPDRFIALADERLKLKEAERESGKRLDEIENEIKQTLAGNTFGVLPDGRTFSFKSQEKKAFEVKASKTRILRFK